MRPEQYVRSFAPSSEHPQSLAEELLGRFFNARGPQSFRECYVQITGDKNVTGLIANCNRARFREALDTGSWPDVFSAAVARRMVQEYRRPNHWQVWRKLVSVSPHVPDFRTQKRVRYGGYGDLPTVNEGSPYLALPSPSDESASFALQKRGGTEDITLEMIKNDDVSAIRALPKRLAETAHRTLAHFALDMLRTNAVIYDGLPLFDAAHGNLGAAALSAAALAAARDALRHQTELDSGDRLGLDLRYLVVPFDLEETAVNLFRRGTNNDRTFLQNLDVEVVPIWYWTDASDWCVMADQDAAPTIELGFLDGNEEPEIFIQDKPTSGSMFSNDRTTFKIRHIYGGAVIDYRGIYKSVLL